LDDPLRLAAVIIYARGAASGAYAQERRAAAMARSDTQTAEFWEKVQAAIIALLPTASSDGKSFH
jgi:hypothetical protein